jgi:hypothetical protein
MMRKTTCLIGVRVANALASTAAGTSAVTGSGGAFNCWPVTGSTVPGGASAAVVGEDDAAGSSDRGAAHAKATAARTSAAARERVRR